MQTARPQLLSDKYYLANFHRLASFVRDTYRDILTPDELQWYASLQACSEQAQQLYIRLLTRKGSVFRMSRLRYPEIDSLLMAAQELEACALGDTSPPDSLSVLIGAYTKTELVNLTKQADLASQPRVTMVESLLAADENSQRRWIHTLQQKDSWVTVTGHQHWTVFRLGFFGNLYQDSSEFVLQDLGTVRYESYTIAPRSRPFATREQLEAHLRYFECEALIDTIDQKDSEQLQALVRCLPQMIADDEHLRRRVDRFRNRIARQLERLGRQVDAFSLYSASVHPPSRERRVRILLQENRHEDARQLLNDISQQPFNDAEVQVATRLQRRLNLACGLAVKRTARFRPESTRLTLVSTPQRVELAAQAFYSRFGACYYTENALVCSVLGLFIWDIIYHPVPGAFFNPFQWAPADFYQPTFHTRRAKLLSARYEELSDPDQFTNRITNNYSQHRGKTNPLVRWSRLSEELMTTALQRIPLAHWRYMFQRMVGDLRENCAGFPDLVLFRKQDDYEFIEIKGPGDVLQQNQLRWMDYFNQHDIPCRVVNIRWARPIEQNVPDESCVESGNTGNSKNNA